jgi:hypothetical protein
MNLTASGKSRFEKVEMFTKLKHPYLLILISYETAFG